MALGNFLFIGFCRQDIKAFGVNVILKEINGGTDWFY